jgi:hypothetical protein
MVLSNKSATIIRLISNIALIFFNSFVTIILFSQFGSNKWYKLLWTGLGVMIVFIQIYSLMQTKGAKGKKKISPLIAYCITTVFSIIGTVGFTLSEIAQGKKEQTTETIIIENTEEDINYYKKKIEGFEGDIEVLRKENEKENTPSWKRSENTASMKRFQKEIDTAEIEWKGAKKERIVESKESAKSKVKAVNTFDYIAEALTIIPKLKLTGEGLKNFLMLLLSFVFEYFVFYTAEPLKEKEEEKIENKKEDIKEEEIKYEDTHFNSLIRNEEKDRLEKYIEFLYDKTTKDNLNSDEYINQVSGLSIEDCNRYRKSLLNMQWQDTPLFMEKKEILKSRFLKEDILKVMKFKFSFQE